MTMNKQEAEEILGEAIQEDNSVLYTYANGYMAWKPEYKVIIIDGEFTQKEMAAITWWMDTYAK